MTRSPQIAPSKPLFHKLGGLQFKDLVQLQTATIMHNLKELSKLLNTSPPSISAIHKHNTREANNMNYFIPRVRPELRKKFLKYVGPKLWHDIPNQLKKYSQPKFSNKNTNITAIHIP